MSIKDTTRTYAGVTLERGRSGVVAASSRLRALPDGALDLTRGAVGVARRQALATVGAADAFVATVTRQREEVPARAKQTAEKLAETAKSRVTHAGDVVARAQSTVVRATTSTGHAKDAYAKLTVRGEQVAADLRHDPVVVRIIRQADARVDRAANGVTSVAQKVRARATAQAKREGAAATSTPVRPTPAKRVPANRTTAHKTPAAEAPVSATPTHRAAAQEAATRAAAAKKAAATRKAAADEAAAKREAAAKKAAATRKKTAAEREAKAEARHDAAVQAAATRKKNASQA